MCCNHCNKCVITYLNAMSQGHIMRYTLKVHNLQRRGSERGWGTYFGKFSKFNTVDTKY